MAYWSYMMECFKDGESRCYYTGQTSNLWKRLGQHFDNVRYRRTETFTGRFTFVKLVWRRRCSTRDEALHIERTVKELPHREKRRLVKRKRRV